jgi:signal peptidase
LKALANGANIIISLMLVGVAIGLAFVALPIFSNTALIVRSASMQPTIPVGGVVVVSPQERILSPQPALIAPKYNIGDVISFRNETNAKIITTHRVVNAEIKDGKVFYQTKGDANNTPDNNLVAEANVIGRSWLSIPFIGRLFAFTKSNIGFPLLVIFPALLVIIFESINIFKEFKKQRKIFQNQFSSRISLAGVKVLVPLVVSILVFQNSFAFFSDTAQSANNTFTAGQFGPPIANHVVINEVYYDVAPGKGSEGDTANPDEWVELYNPTGISVDIKDWTIGDNVDSNNVSSAQKFIPPGGFALIAKSNSTWANWDEDPDADKIPIGDKIGNGLANDGDRVVLRDNNGNIIDQMSWGTDTSAFTPSATDVAEGHSLERDPDGVDTNTAVDFVDRTTPTPGT